LVLSVGVAGARQVRVQGAAVPQLDYRVQGVTNLAGPASNWVPVGTARADANGRFELVDTNGLGWPRRFYRAVQP
jgi:hypothetical protein